MSREITMTYRPPFLVKLTYFKPSGKYYSGGEYHTKELHLFEIWEEVKDMLKKGNRPGLVDCTPGENEFHVLISVPFHPHDHPHLIVL